MISYKIAILSGDGIGPEVTREAVKVLRTLEKKSNISFEFEEALVGGVAYDKTGNPFPEETLQLAKRSDSVLLGAIGGPKWERLDYSMRPERALLGLRKEMSLFANLRPVIVFSSLADASTLKREVVQDIDILIVRELTSGIYFGEPRGVTQISDGSMRGVNTLVYTSAEIERVAKVAFELARKRSRKLTSVDKANVLESMELWRNVVGQVHKDYSDVELSHMYVDNCSMQLIRNPKQFDVILTENMFGDILSDEAAMLTGSIGMLPSASLNESSKGLFEPVHGSAPDIAGKDLANPLATILSVAMMLEYSFDQPEEGQMIRNAVKSVLDKGYRTADIYTKGAKKVNTTKMGDLVCLEIKGG